MNFIKTTLTKRKEPAKDVEKDELDVQEQEQERRRKQLAENAQENAERQEYIDQTRRPTYVPSPITFEKLSLFRFLVGITSDSSMETSVFGRARPAANLGIYRRVVYEEHKADKSYKIFALIINLALGLQIIVAAALTALGASGSNSHAVTVFGAVNTVIAGFLTFLKGSGLPNRLQYYEDQWRQIREYIEQRERDFSRDDCPLDVYQEAQAIDVMYQEMKADIHANTPDSFVSATQLRKSPTVQPASTGMLAKLSDNTQKANDSAVAASTSASASAFAPLAGSSSAFGDKTRDYAYEAQRKGNMVVDQAEQGVNTTESKVTEVQQAGKDIANFATYRISDIEPASSANANEAQDNSYGLAPTTPRSTGL